MDIFVKVKMNAEDGKAAIKQLSALLYERGYVKKSYLRGVLEREEKYPTGLRLKGGINAALPHAEIEHVLKPALAVGMLEKPVTFRNMERPEEFVENVRIVFMPALDKPHEYMKFLGSFAGKVLQEPKIIEELSSASTPSEVSKILEEQLT